MALLYSAACWVIFPHSTGFRLFYIHEHISFLPLQAYECLSAHHPRVKPFSQPLRAPFIFPILLVCSVIWDLDKLLPTAGQPLPPPPPAVAAFPEPVVDLSPMEIDFFFSCNQCQPTSLPSTLPLHDLSKGSQREPHGQEALTAHPTE